MIKVKFSSNGKLREALNGDIEVAVEATALTLHEAIRIVGDRLQGEQRTLLLDDEKETIQEHILLAVNDEMVTDNESLQDGDHIRVLMPMAGG